MDFIQEYSSSEDERDDKKIKLPQELIDALSKDQKYRLKRKQTQERIVDELKEQLREAQEALALEKQVYDLLNN